MTFWLSNWLHNFTKEGRRWKYVSPSVAHESHRLLWDSELHLYLYKRTALIDLLVMSQMNPLHVLLLYFLRSVLILSFHLHLGLPPDLVPLCFTSKFLYSFVIWPSPTCLIPFDWFFYLVKGANYQCSGLWKRRITGFTFLIDIYNLFNDAVSKCGCIWIWSIYLLTMNWSCPDLKSFLGIRRDRSRRTTESPRQVSQCLGRDSNLAPPKYSYKPTAFLLQPTGSVYLHCRLGKDDTGFNVLCSALHFSQPLICFCN